MLFFHIRRCFIGLYSQVKNIKFCVSWDYCRVSLSNLLLGFDWIRIIIEIGMVIGVFCCSWRWHVIILKTCFKILAGRFGSVFWLIVWFADCWCPKIEFVKSIIFIRLGARGIVWSWFFSWRWQTSRLCFDRGVIILD